MKKTKISVITFIAIFTSCAKESIPSNIDDNTNFIEVCATIQNADTKTNYDVGSTSATFYWTGTETIGRLWYKSSFGQDAFTSTTSADNKETSLIFRGYDSPDKTDYAMFPIWNGTSKTGIGWRSSPFDLYLHDSMVYNSETPLKDVVPMIAKVNGSGELDFVPISGVIAVTVKNLPSTATKITLSSTGKALSGYYRLTYNPASYYSDNLTYVMNNGLTVAAASAASNTNGTKTFTFSELDRSAHTFYFPVSVGTFDDMTITIFAGNTTLQTVSTTKDITVEKGQIVKLPEMDLAKATKVVITGATDEAFIYVDTFGPEATSVKFAIANSSDAAISSVTSDGMSITASGAENKKNIYASLIESDANSGQYYLAYTIYSSSEELRTVVQSVYYLKATDKGILCGDYGFTALKALTINNRSAWTDFTSANPTYVSEGYTDAHMVIAPSNNLSQGTIMLANFLDFGYEGVTNKSITEEKLLSNNNKQVNFQGTYAAGEPLYGTFRNSDYLITLYGTNPLFILDDVKYYLRHVKAQYNYFNFEVSYDSSTVTLTYGSSSGMCIVNDAQITAQGGSGSYGGAQSTVIFANVTPQATRTK